MRLPPVLLLIPLIAGCGEARAPAPAAPMVVFTTTVDPPPAAAPALVPVEVHKKEGEKDIYTYGWVERATLERLVAGPDLPKFIKIHDAYWFDDYGATMLEDDEKSGTYYLRIETLRDVSEFKPRTVESVRAREKEADAKRKKAKEVKEAAKAGGEAKDVLP